jgi:ABC-type uncharacterized transport system auxiliary subunit
MLVRPRKLLAPLAMGLPLLIAGCVSMLEREPVTTFQLRGAGASAAQVASSLPVGERIAVAVERPLASGAVAGDRLVVEVDDQLRFVSGARWEDDLPELLAAELSLALQTTEGIDVVDAAQRAGRPDFGLVTVIERMQVELDDDYSGRAVTEIIARLVEFPSREIIATSVFRGEAPAADDAPGTLAQAIREATQKSLAELAGWVAVQTRESSGQG